jgi:hypothetical protein
MDNQQLQDYIKQQLQQGVPQEDIRRNLTSSGWQPSDIDSAFPNTPSQSSPSQITQSSPEQATQLNKAVDSSKNRKAEVGLVLGIVSLLAWLIPLIGLPVAIIGLVYGIKGLKSLNHRAAVIAIILGSVGLVASIANASIGAYQGATGQHPLVNQLLGTDSQSSENELQSDQTINGIDAEKAELIRQTVQQAKAEYILPYKLDQVTTIVDITAEDDAIRYHYVISGGAVDMVTNEALRENVRQSICNNPDTRGILDQDIHMEYSYSIADSSQKYFVKLTKADCQ